MTDINLQALALTPTSPLAKTGFLFGAESQGAAGPSVYTTQAVATTLLGSTSLTGDTLTASAPVLNLTQTWNSSGVTFTGMAFNAAGTSNANSAALSRLVEFQVGGVAKAGVVKDGAMFADLGIWKSAATSYNGANYHGIALINGSIDFYAPNFTGNFPVRFGLGGGAIAAGFASSIGFTASTAATTPDAIISYKGTRNLQLGAADAATALAQTLSVQSVVAGTTDGAGAAFTLTGSQSTGTGVPGNILIQTASSAASTGFAQNALATVATFGPSTLRLAQTTPALDLAQTWNTSGTPTALKLNVTNTASNAASLLMDLQVGGTSQFRVTRTGQLFTTNVGDFGGYVSANNGLYVNSNGTSVGLFFGLSADTILIRKAAANLQLGAADAAAPVAQTLSVQSIVGGGGTPNLSAAAYPFKITGAQGTGQGAGGSIIFQTAPAAVSSGNGQNGLTDALTIDSVGSVRVVRALTVATLPGTPLAGMIARVSDALTPVIGMTVASGGAAYALVNYNGSNWTVIGV